MGSAENGDEEASITPEAAFALLGNETRTRTLQALADAEDGICDHCQRRLGLRIRLDCTNCTYEFDGPSLTGLLDAPELLAFAGAHGFNVTSTGIDWGWEWDEAVLSTDPFRCRIDVTIDEETLSLVVDEHLDVVESTRGTIADP